jgi:hypothetical protein
VNIRQLRPLYFICGEFMKRVKETMCEYHLNLRYNNNDYSVKVLVFEDDTGARIGFYKGKKKDLTVIINNIYEKKLIKAGLKNTYGYTLCPEQIEIFIEWLTK